MGRRIRRGIKNNYRASITVSEAASAFSALVVAGVETYIRTVQARQLLAKYLQMTYISQAPREGASINHTYEVIWRKSHRLRDDAGGYSSRQWHGAVTPSFPAVEMHVWAT
jgi:hypothetical protein